MSTDIYPEITDPVYVPARLPPTLRQTIARQENGRLSHGPTTTEGKARSHMSGFKHGMFAKAIPVWAFPGMVSREDYEAMLADLKEEYHPQTPTEHLLVESLALEFIKLGRVSALEMLVLDWSPAPGCDSVNLLENLHGMTRGKSVEEIERQLALLEELFACIRDGTPPSLAPDDAASIADRLWRIICATGDVATIGAIYGVASQEDVESVLRGKVVPIEHTPAWSAALMRIKGLMDEEYTRVHRAHDELAGIRTASNAVTLRNLPRLSLLGQYSATLQRNINRIIGQLKAGAPSRTASCKPITTVRLFPSRLPDQPDEHDVKLLS